MVARRYLMMVLGSPIFSNLLYLLLVAGLWLAALAIVSPGTGTLEVLAFFALAGAGIGTLFLPPNGWAVIVLILGVVFLVMSLRLKRVEIWLGMSAVAFCLGSVFLFRLDSGGPAVHPLLAIVVSLMTLGYFWLAIRNAILAHQAGPTIDPALVLDQIGEVRTAIDPIGSVFVVGELWTARADAPIEVGAPVRVLDREGLVLTVEAIEPSEDMPSGEGG
jgi:membrane-bound serine protease (ClpP class)